MSAPVLFGKLPARADFVLRGGASPALDALDTLAQNALRAGLTTKTGPLYRMVFVPPSGPQALAGAIQLSRDRVGRAYPLFAGQPISRPRLDPDAAASWPLRWRPVLGAAARLIEVAVQDAPLSDVDARLTALPSLAPLIGRSPEIDYHITTLSVLPISELVNRIWGEDDPMRLGLVVQRLRDAAHATIPYGVRFPLPPSESDFGTSDAVAFWLAVCWHLLPTPPTPPSLFWTEGAPGALVVFVSGLSPAAFRPLLTGTSLPDRIAAVDAGSPGTARRIYGALPARFREFLESPSTSVTDLLGHLHALR
ncbi:MAG: type VI secretion system-associated protein TagF [Bacteroidota bacterium]